jgi:phosphate transport system permease protein
MLDGGLDESPRSLVVGRTPADRAYRGIALGAAGTTLLILVLIGLFLFIRALPAFRLNGLSFFTAFAWNPEGTGHHAGIGAVMFGTVAISLIALIIAVPVSIATALFITEYAPRGVRRWLTSMVDLLAAVPSLVYGIWGVAFLQPRLIGISRWLAHNLGFVPIFKVTNGTFFASPFVAGVVVSLMVLPIATSVIREVFSQTPPGEKEAALALGGSRWGMIRAVVLPFGRGGMIGGSMLGLGRALGETIAVALIISPVFTVSPHILQTGGNSVASLIANRFGDATQQYGIPALMAAGLALFVLTLLVNTLASLVVARSRSGKGVEI